ncbi:hypothetical protein A3738_26295, partial [Oleiphilus sp. HI0066]
MLVDFALVPSFWRLFKNHIGIRSLKLLAIVVTSCLLLSQVVHANSDQTQNNQDLKAEASQLKQSIIELNQELHALEQAMIYPPEVKFGVFLSLDDKTRFKLDSIELFVDDALISTHLYQNSDIQALLNGGVQQLYLGSVAPGQHKLTASFKGQGRSGGYFKRKKSLKFDKTKNARYIELIVSERPG